VALETAGQCAYKAEAAMPTAEENAQKQFDEDDKRWTAPKFMSLGAVTLFIAISLIYAMSTTTGCSLQIVP
jgi:hypothetical protein